MNIKHLLTKLTHDQPNRLRECRTTIKQNRLAMCTEAK